VPQWDWGIAVAQGGRGLEEAPVAGGGTMGTRAGGGATHTYRDSKKSVITHPWLSNKPKIIFIPLNIIYEQKPFVTLKKLQTKRWTKTTHSCLIE
jgi:hypothetical protein